MALGVGHLIDLGGSRLISVCINYEGLMVPNQVLLVVSSSEDRAPHLHLRVSKHYTCIQWYRIYFHCINEINTSGKYDLK